VFIAFDSRRQLTADYGIPAAVSGEQTSRAGKYPMPHPENIKEMNA
jgi:hypothetical protein